MLPLLLPPLKVAFQRATTTMRHPIRGLIPYFSRAPNLIRSPVFGVSDSSTLSAAFVAPARADLIAIFVTRFLPRSSEKALINAFQFRALRRSAASILVDKCKAQMTIAQYLLRHEHLSTINWYFGPVSPTLHSTMEFFGNGNAGYPKDLR